MMNQRGGIGIDFLLNLFIVGGIGLYIFLNLWNAITPSNVTQVNNLEGGNDTIVLLLLYLVPVLVAVRIVREALKGSDDTTQQG